MLNKIYKSKLYSYFVDAFKVREYRRGWLKGNCPSCGRVDKFGINLSMNKTNCFVCGFHPSPINLLMEREGFDNFQDARKFINLYEGRQYLEPVVERIERTNAILPEGYHNLLIGDSLLGRKARDYVKNRGFDIEEMAYKGWGYSVKGNYFGYIIIPFYVGGKLIYYNGRRYFGGGPKYKNPKIEDFGIGKSLIIYNSDALALYNEIYLLEGVINAETLGDQAIACGGKKISKYQISMLIKSEVEKIILLLDPDAIDESIKVGFKLIYHKEIKLIVLPEDKDVNDLGKEKTLELVNGNQWLDYNGLIKFRNEFEYKKKSEFTHN